jgi:hypothetical protein
MDDDDDDDDDGDIRVDKGPTAVTESKDSLSHQQKINLMNV